MSDAYGANVGSYHSRKLAFAKAHGELIDHIQRGNSDAAYILTRFIVALSGHVNYFEGESNV